MAGELVALDCWGCDGDEGCVAHVDEELSCLEDLGFLSLVEGSDETWNEVDSKGILDRDQTEASSTISMQRLTCAI